ncbi:hypothetical protein Anapl_06623 [Anas platyrhynchos]|uniref:Uncharacterized protein n=1 Tax=Anas platyrhynchos TaxID=8839 RepID=R0LP20_ANAPL|nr:hypothetical protein Anapl_06623 [Anas platyrhynchos]
MGSEGPRFKPRGKSFQNGAAFVPCTLRVPGFYSAALSVRGMRLLESPTFRHLDNLPARCKEKYLDCSCTTVRSFSQNMCVLSYVSVNSIRWAFSITSSQFRKELPLHTRTGSNTEKQQQMYEWLKPIPLAHVRSKILAVLSNLKPSSQSYKEIKSHLNDVKTSSNA